VVILNKQSLFKQPDAFGVNKQSLFIEYYMDPLDSGVKGALYVLAPIKYLG
jgi:hypothetical protein